MAKKKNKQIIRPWCWYCEREFEDEKVLMQHQKAKHFKCNLCPRRLNTAGGLAVHIQQVHKLEPENLPRIENALPGRDGYEVEIFGMEGIPAPDVADYKRRKEIELGLNPGSISQPQAKRPKIENRPLSEQELKAQLEAHKALMGASDANAAPPQMDPNSGGAVYGAPPQSYSAAPSLMPPPMAPGMPPMMPPGAPHFIPGGMPPPGAFPGGPPFPMPGMPGMPPGMPPPGFPLPPGMLPPGIPGGPPPFPPGGLPTFFPAGMPPPPGFGISPPPGFSAGNGLPPPGFPPNGIPPPGSVLPLPGQPGGPPPSSAPTPPAAPPAQLTIPNPALAQSNPPFKKATELKWTDANFSPDEQRSIHPQYWCPKGGAAANAAASGAVPGVSAEETRGKKRARAEDFL